MNRAESITAWQRAAAWAVECLCIFTALASHLAAWACPVRFGLMRPVVAPLVGWVIGAPMLLGRQGFYVGLCRAGCEDFSVGWLAMGWRRFVSAVGWYWHLWIRRTFLWALVALPAVVLWWYGTRQGALSPLWLVAGGLALLGGWVLGQIWLCRYAIAPLLILEGYPAAAALQLSARAMRRRRIDYLSFWMTHIGRLALCLLIVPAWWQVPLLRREKTALLLRYRAASGIPIANG